MMKRKGQSATEYLMTYGWAILAIVIVAAVLWNMGIFGGAGCSEYLSGFSGSQLYVDNAVVHTDGSVDIHARNAAGVAITIRNSTSEYPYTLDANKEGTFANVTIISGVSGSAGDCISGKDFTVTYNISGLIKSSTGKISGTLQ